MAAALLVTVRTNKLLISSFIQASHLQFSLSAMQPYIHQHSVPHLFPFCLEGIIQCFNILLVSGNINHDSLKLQIKLKDLEIGSNSTRFRTRAISSRLISGLPRCKNLTRFSLFVSFCFAVRYCLKCFCFLCFTSSVSFTGSYTEVQP